MGRLSLTTFLISPLLLLLPSGAQSKKPPLTLDEFFDAVDIGSVQISPDGHAVVIETSRADWAANRFRNDLWLYRDESGGSLVQLTQSGHDRSPQWSPDGQWIAFLSNREKDVAQVYVISSSGGEAFPVTFGDDEVHAFAWSGDSRRIYFATRDPQTKEEREAYAEEWKDVVQFRETERGDTLFGVDVARRVSKKGLSAGLRGGGSDAEKLAALPSRVSQIEVSSDGRFLALATDSPSERLETHDPYGIFVADLAGGTLHQAIHTQEGVDAIYWARDSRHVLFTYEAGTPEGPYHEEVQTRLYEVDLAGDKAIRWAPGFSGEVGVRYTADPDGDFAVVHDGSVLIAGRLGTEVEPYVQSGSDAELAQKPAWAGTYEMFSAARDSQRVAFVYSSFQQPREVYISESVESFQQARPITAFNQLLAKRALPGGRKYRWTADDGTRLEGILIYPPGKFGAKHLPMFTWIHGGPQMADGDEFRSPHVFAWFALAATQGWLVFDPNYRGSTGYGDAFTLGFVPHLNSRPGKDILEGVSALVDDGIADPEQLTVGGYSQGGFLTNWLITQTTRFKAAVTGAGAVENGAMWGNSDVPLYFAYSLGGVPWQAKSNYTSEAAIWQIDRVTTPTLIVEGSEDTNVPPFEAYLLEGALQEKRVPHSLLIFPGEGHNFDINPWHAKIAAREELKWLDEYGRKK